VAVNRPGFGHIAFVVNDVPSAREAVLAAGGQSVGDVVTLVTAAGSKVRPTGGERSTASVQVAREESVCYSTFRRV
jgi:hypothetical protein